MSAPNIVNVTSIQGKTVGGLMTTTTTDILHNPASSGKVFKVNSAYVSNVDGVNNADASLDYYNAATSTWLKLLNTVVVPADSTLDVISKGIYLEEGDKLATTASADGDLHIIISYEEIS